LYACTKDILIELPDAEIKYVIEGTIENGSYPTVIVTKSTGYFEVVNLQTLMNMRVTGSIKQNI